MQERYLHFAKKRFGALVDSLESIDTPHARMLRTVMHLAERLHEAPVLLFVCGHRDWPAAVPIETRVGKAPAPYGSIYPCAQNIPGEEASFGGRGIPGVRARLAPGTTRKRT